MTVNKQLFYEAINQDTVFDEEFFKKVYGYSVYDAEFEEQVTFLLDIFEKEKAIQNYLEWKHQYEDNHSAEMVAVAKWYHKWLNDRQEREVRAGNVRKQPGEEYRFKGFSQI